METKDKFWADCNQDYLRDVNILSFIAECPSGRKLQARSGAITYMKKVWENGNGSVRNNIGTEQALKKAMQYCAYQERSHAEVREKLYGYGLGTAEVDELLARLISENFLNEERYAIAFAGGKFRMKQWGRQKIRYALRMRNVSDYCIRKALSSIDPDEYEQLLEKLFLAKKKTLSSEKNIFIKKAKTRAYLIQKGFEADMVDELIRRYVE